MLPMKKLKSDNRTLTLGNDDVEDIEEVKEVKIKSKKNEKYEYDEFMQELNKFSNSKSLNGVKTEIKLKSKIEKYENTFTKILSTIEDINDPDKLENVFKVVLQSIEDYIYCEDKEKCNQIKHDLAIKLLKGLVDDDVNLCEQIMKMSLKNVKKSTFLRRNRLKIQRLIFFVLKMLVRVF